MLVPYYIGDLYLQLSGVDGRLKRVRMAVENLTIFLDRCDTAELLSKQEKAAYARAVKEGGFGAAKSQTREEKIAAFKRNKERKLQLEALFKKREAFYKKNSDSSAEEDEVERKYILLLIEGYVHQACEHITFTKEEIQLLEHREKLESQPDFKQQHEQRKPAQPKPPNVYRIDNPDMLNQPIPDHMKGMLAKVPTVANTLDRQALINAVFRDPNPPTMSLDDWVDQQQAQGLLPTPGQANQTNMNQLPQEPEEKEPTQEEADAQQEKDRAWADWTDDNEKGVGNRRRHW
mmetsp:Transcript_4875/g.7768  ORF Transcript_4875/g.7768 Transcript_4875/m.7768 type:complete len:290 (+) Transcript_4875:105-974(+)